MNKFFDRNLACKEMNDAISIARQNNPMAVWIEGRSGVGKTRFMTYISEKEQELNLFTFMDDEYFYRCEKGSSESSFENISAVISELQRRNPKHFELFIQKYFDSLEHISFFEACCLVLPQIKCFSGISKLIESKYNSNLAMQNKISDRLVTYQLADLFSQLILSFLSEEYEKSRITFAIDDSQWLDPTSLHVLETLIKKSRRDGKEPVISLIVAINEKNELEEGEVRNYHNIYRVLSTLFPGMKTIYLENFDYATTSEVIYDTNRVYLVQQIPLIYKMTKGNPLELDQTLRFSDERIRRIIQNNAIKLAGDATNSFSCERIDSVYFESQINSVILSSLSILRRRISIRFLFTCSSDIYSHIFGEICSYPCFSETLYNLKASDFIKLDLQRNEVSIEHDHIRQSILDYLTQNGDYVLYGKQIAQQLLSCQDDNTISTKAKNLLALNLLIEVDPNKCFLQFQQMYERCNGQLEAELFDLGAASFCSSFFSRTSEDISFAVKNVLPRLISSSNLKTAQRLCITLMPKGITGLLITDRISFLMNFIKAQVDLSVVESGEYSAINLFEILYSYNCDDKETLLRILTLGMSVYEHVLANDKILSLFRQAENLVADKEACLSNEALATFYRNKGLCYPHSELKVDYFHALCYSVKIHDTLMRRIMFGTCMNNLGLSYFYSGNVKRAIKAFNISKNNLNSIGYDTARISNNIGACYFLLHKYELAYQYFSEATATHMDGVFMNLCLLTNLAISLYKIGKTDDAKHILDGLILEYKNEQARSKNTLIYCAAMINRGYIAFQEKDYFKAAELYNFSLLHTYRYQNKEQVRKRENMRDIALSFANINIPTAKMDLEDSGSDYYLKPYSLIPFAFYVI